MNRYETRGAALDRFLTEYEINPDDVLSVDLSPLERRGGICVHIYVPVSGLEYVPDEETPRYTTADVEWEDLTISVIYVHSDDKEVPA